MEVGITHLRVALVHDWLVGMRGGERCLESLCRIFPQAEVFTLFYRPEKISSVINERRPRVSVLGKLPGVWKYYRHLFPFYPLGISDLNRQIQSAHQTRPFDLIISVSHCAVKNITPPTGVPHVCYCLTPARYLFDQYDAYFKGKALEPLIRRIVKRIRRWDLFHTKNVSHFIAISEFVSARIRRVYGRESSVVFPPVETSWIPVAQERSAGDFLCVCALVPYKNVDLIVNTCVRDGVPLTVVGSGPEERRLRNLDHSGIVKFHQFLSDKELGALYCDSRALLFAAEEDFGMTPVEIQAAGRPVIALGKGGALETVVAEPPGVTGVLFSEPNYESLSAAIRDFRNREDDFTLHNCIKQASRFAPELFVEGFVRSLVQAKVVAPHPDPAADRASFGS